MIHQGSQIAEMILNYDLFKATNLVQDREGLSQLSLGGQASLIYKGPKAQGLLIHQGNHRRKSLSAST